MLNARLGKFNADFEKERKQKGEMKNIFDIIKRY